MGSLFSSPDPPKFEPLLHAMSTAQLHQVAEFKHAKDIIPIARNVMKSVNRMGETSRQTMTFAKDCLAKGEELHALSVTLKQNKGDTGAIARAKVIIGDLLNQLKYQLAASIATSDTLGQASVQMRSFQSEFASLTTAVDTCSGLLGSWRSSWYIINGELDAAHKGLDSIDPAGALFRLFPDVKLDVFQKQMNTVIRDADNSIQLVPKVIKSLQDSIEAACNVHVNIGPYGGNGGSAFADPQHDYKDALTKIVVYSGDYVDSFQCIYTSGNGNRHGGTGGSRSEVALANGENIVRITGTYKSYLNTIAFTTSTGKEWHFGNNRGTDSFDVKVDSGVLQSITGRSGKYMDQISFVFTTSPHFDNNANFSIHPVSRAFALTSDMKALGVTGAVAQSNSIEAEIDYAQYLQKV